MGQFNFTIHHDAIQYYINKRICYFPLITGNFTEFQTLWESYSFVYVRR